MGTRKTRFRLRARTLGGRILRDAFFRLLGLRGRVARSISLRPSNCCDSRGPRVANETTLGRLCVGGFGSGVFVCRLNLGSDSYPASGGRCCLVFRRTCKDRLNRCFEGVCRVLGFISRDAIRGGGFCAGLLHTRLSDCRLTLLFFGYVDTLNVRHFGPLIRGCRFFRRLPHLSSVSGTRVGVCSGSTCNDAGGSFLGTCSDPV